MEDNIKEIPREGLSKDRDRMQITLDQLFGPSSQTRRLELGITQAAISAARRGRKPLVSGWEGHWTVLRLQIRTQNNIKNRFYGTLRNYIRFVLASLADVNQTFNGEISKLSPNYLNDIYWGKGCNFSFRQSLASWEERSRRPSSRWASKLTKTD